MDTAILFVAGFEKVPGDDPIYRLKQMEVLVLDNAYSFWFFNAKGESIQNLYFRTSKELADFLLSIREFSDALKLAPGRAEKAERELSNLKEKISVLLEVKNE